MTYASALTALALTGAVSMLAAVGAAAQQPAPPTPASKRTTAHARQGTSPAALRAAAKISEDSARRVALARVPGGTVKESELEREKGTVVYSFDIIVAGKEGVEEVLVSALDGHVVEQVHESAAAERHEAEQERRANAAKRARARTQPKPGAAARKP